MNRPLQLLIVEDDATDAELIVRQVRRAGFEPEWHCVDTEADYLAKLRPDLDVILSDYQMPEFSGLRALELLQDRALEIPFIIVSGAIGEETAVATMKLGAADYLLKDRLARLGPAIHQAMEQRRLRQHRKHMEAAVLCELESRLFASVGRIRLADEMLQTEIAERHRIEREILENSEREQRRLCEELHKGLSDELAGIALLGSALAKQLQDGNHPLARIAEGLASRTCDAIESARLVARGLYPIDLQRCGLLFALQDLANQTSRCAGISCKLQLCGAAPTVSRWEEIHIYRIMEEWVRNALQHRAAQHIMIEAATIDGGPRFTVTDDGIGFERPPGGSGVGLQLMEYRARVIGAKLGIEKAVAGGCRFTYRMPRMGD